MYRGKSAHGVEEEEKKSERQLMMSNGSPKRGAWTSEIPKYLNSASTHALLVTDAITTAFSSSSSSWSLTLSLF